MKRMISSCIAVVLLGWAFTETRAQEVQQTLQASIDKGIAYLQSTIPSLASMDTDAALALAPKPSPVVNEVLKQAGTTPVTIPRVPIDRP